jgi:hypothetical protein
VQKQRKDPAFFHHPGGAKNASDNPVEVTAALRELPAISGKTENSGALLWIAWVKADKNDRSAYFFCGKP